MDIKAIKGINEKREQDFKKLGVTDTRGLISFFPRAYLDLRKRQLLRDCYHNDIVLTYGKVVAVPKELYSAHRSKYVKAVCEQNGEPFTVIWFHQPYVLSRLKPGKEYLFYGRVQNKFGQPSMVNPSFEEMGQNYKLKGIVPQYSCRGSLTQKVIRDSVKTALLAERPETIIPPEFCKKYALPDLYYAYRSVHQPDSFEQKNLAAERIAVEEYFSLISAFRFIKGSREQVRTRRYRIDADGLKRFAQRFPFAFTDGQKKAVNDIFSDLRGGTVMNRLLQGDVGSGKTAVALCALYAALASGYQAVLLAPTEVLARQSFALAMRYFPEYRIGLLTGSVPAKEKKAIKCDLKSGEIRLLIGTHAVLEDDVAFESLALCVCDEQHRFGVSQRAVLTDKGKATDMLVMSATPIPRTLSLIFYGDLDISTIEDKPKNRCEIQTNVVPHYKYEDMLEFIRGEVGKGRQVYFVCPKIEEDEEGAIMSVTELYEELSHKLFGLRLGLLHGKMKDAEKNAVMADFKEGRLDCLVSTTVIEVGVDVPNASIMVIYNAERFGLSQLHQLRGRVGRSELKSYCFLLTGSESPSAVERLKIMKTTNDGFKISEYDYEMRGSGDFLGTRQSGKFMGELGNLNYSTASIFLAKKISDEVFSSCKNLDLIRAISLEKYNRLKDVTLN